MCPSVHPKAHVPPHPLIWGLSPTRALNPDCPPAYHLCPSSHQLIQCPFCPFQPQNPPQPPPGAAAEARSPRPPACPEAFSSLLSLFPFSPINPPGLASPRNASWRTEPHKSKPCCSVVGSSLCKKVFPGSTEGWRILLRGALLIIGSQPALPLPFFIPGPGPDYFPPFPPQPPRTEPPPASQIPGAPQHPANHPRPRGWGVIISVRLMTAAR